MKAAAWKKLAQQYLISSLPEARLAGSVIVFGNIDWILHALVVDTSAFSGTRVRITVFSQPLYVPIKGTILTYGEVLRHPRSRHEWWDEGDGEELALAVLEAFRQQARSVLGQADSPAGLAAYSERRYPDSINPPTIEMEAYSWALAWNLPKFVRACERIKRTTSDLSTSYAYTWLPPLLDRMRTVQQAVEAGPAELHRILGEWRDDSIRQHKLHELTAPYTVAQW